MSIVHPTKVQALVQCIVVDRDRVRTDTWGGSRLRLALRSNVGALMCFDIHHQVD